MSEPTRELSSSEYTAATVELVHQINTHVWDMTPEAAKAHTEIARLQHAVPAEQATKQAEESTKQAQEITLQTKETTTRTVRRAEEETKRHWIQFGFTGACVIAGFVTLHFCPSEGLAIVGIIGVMGAGQAVTKWLDKKKKADE